MTRRRHNQNQVHFHDLLDELFDNRDNMDQPGRNDGNGQRGRNNNRGNFRNINNNGNNNNHGGQQQVGHPLHDGHYGRPPTPRYDNQHAAPVQNPNPRYKGKNFDPNYRVQKDYTAQNHQAQQLQKQQQWQQRQRQQQQQQSSPPRKEPQQQSRRSSNPFAHAQGGPEGTAPQGPCPHVDISGDSAMCQGTNCEELAFTHHQLKDEFRFFLDAVARHEGPAKIIGYMSQYVAAKPDSALSDLMRSWVQGG